MQLKIAPDLQPVSAITVFTSARNQLRGWNQLQGPLITNPKYGATWKPIIPTCCTGQSRAEKPPPAPGDAAVEEMILGAPGARSRFCHPASVLTEDTEKGSGASAVKQIIVRPFTFPLPRAVSPHNPFPSSLDS